MIATGGRWDPDDRRLYFLADAPRSVLPHPHRYPNILMAVNDLAAPDGQLKPGARAVLDDVLGAGARLLLDSGVYWLTNRHARAHHLPMDVCLAMPPEQVDDFDWLWTAYTTIVAEYGAQLWGYIELDQGGATNKRKTRTKLNDLGFNPMPVFHPFNDGPDYFDELAETHDRLCCGNIVQASPPVRKRLVHLFAERHCAHPSLWIHLLGYTPSETAFAFDTDSCDSTAWLQGVRWDAPKDEVMGRWWSSLPTDFKYRRGSNRYDDDGFYRAWDLSICAAWFAQRNWRHWQQRLADTLGAMPTVTV